MGAWPFASTFIEEVAEDIGCKHPKPRYAGRPSAASPATGMHARHVAEQKALIDESFEVGKKALTRIQARKEAYEARQDKLKKPPEQKS